MKGPLLILISMLFFTGTVAYSAGPFDGDWKGYSHYQSCKTSADFAIKVIDNSVSGTMKYGAYTNTITGGIADDGAFSGMTGGAAVHPITGKFSHDKFEGEFPSVGCGLGTVIMRPVK